MKNFAVLFFAAISLLACKDTASIEEAFATLSESWDQTTASIGALASAAETDIEGWKYQYASIDVTEEMKATLASGQLDELDEIRSKCWSHGDAYKEIQIAVSGLMATWDEKAVALDGLRDQIESGDMPKEASSMIEEYHTFIQEAEVQVGDWRETLDSIGQDHASTCIEEVKKIQQLNKSS